MNEKESVVAVPPKALVDRLVDDGIVGYLTDSQTASEVARWAYEEMGVPRLATRLVMKWLVPILAAGTKKTAGSALARVSKRAHKQLLQIPYYDRLSKWLSGLGARLDEKAKDKQMLDEVLAGRRPPHPETFGRELSSDLRLGLRILDQVDSIDEHFSNYIAELSRKLEDQPPLELLLFDVSPSSRLNFRAQRIPFLGHKHELEALQSFMDHEASFQWWIVTGPGGRGKSRIALELCLRNGTAWRVGFLPKQTSFAKWRSWQPDQPTLIVADYASTRPKDLQTIVYDLQSRTEPLDWPVRLLLLERRIEDYWWSTFMGTGSVSIAVADSRYRDPLSMGQLSDEELCELAGLVWEKSLSSYDSPSEHPGKELFLDTLDRVDPQRRPLYATIVAEALLQDPTAAHSSRYEVVDSLLRRERETFWGTAEVREIDLNLLALATLTDGIGVSALAEIGDGEVFPSTGVRASQRFDPHRYEVLSGQLASDRLAPLQPDIVGEYFVLSHLEPQFAGDEALAETVLGAGWRLRPKGVWSFLSRATADFPEHQTLQSLIQRTTSEAQGKEESPVQMALSNGLLVQEMVRLTDDNRNDDALERFSLIERHYDEADNREPIAFMLASGAVILITKYCQQNALKEARDVFQRLFVRIEEHGLSDLALEPVCHAIHNIGVVEVIAENFDRAVQHVNVLKRIASGEPVDVVKRWLGSAFDFLLRGFATNERLDDAASLLSEIADRVASDPDDQHGRSVLVENVPRVMAMLLEAGKREEAAKVFDRYVELIGDVSEKTNAVEHLASGVAEVIYMTLDVEGLDAALLFFHAASSALGGNRRNRYVRRSLASSSINMVGELAAGGRMDEAMEIHRDLLTANEDETDEDLLFPLAANVANLAINQWRAGEWAKGEEFLKQLLQMSDRLDRSTMLEPIVAVSMGTAVVDGVKSGKQEHLSAAREAAAGRLAEAPQPELWLTHFFGAFEVYLEGKYEGFMLTALREATDFASLAPNMGGSLDPLSNATYRLIQSALAAGDPLAALEAYKLMLRCAEIQPIHPAFVGKWAFAGFTLLMAAPQHESLKAHSKWIFETSSKAVFSVEFDQAATHDEEKDAESQGETLTPKHVEDMRSFYSQIRSYES